MARPSEVLTFDCYGTLIDWEHGIGEAFARAAASRGREVDRRRVLALYAEVEPQVQAEAYRPYREVLAEAAVRVAARLGWTLSHGEAGFLAESLPGWPPFPDTVPALQRLARAGYRLGILSNVDDDLLAGTLRHLPVRFDLLVTAQQVRAYKPAPAHFEAARRWVGDRPWLHVAQSAFHDVAPAGRLGIPVVWVNRKGEHRPEGSMPPAREVRTLAELADWLAGEGG